MRRIAATNDAPGRDHRIVRYLGAVLSGTAGILYLLIGLGVLLGGGDDRGRILLGAAIVFLVLAAYLVFWKRPPIDVLGAAVQVVCIAGYFAMAPSRAPHFEEWGITIKILQAILLSILVYQIMRRAPSGRTRAALAGESAKR